MSGVNIILNRCFYPCLIPVSLKIVWGNALIVQI